MILQPQIYYFLYEIDLRINEKQKINWFPHFCSQYDLNGSTVTNHLINGNIMYTVQSLLALFINSEHITSLECKNNVDLSKASNSAEAATRYSYENKEPVLSHQY